MVILLAKYKTIAKEGLLKENAFQKRIELLWSGDELKYWERLQIEDEEWFEMMRWVERDIFKALRIKWKWFKFSYERYSIKNESFEENLENYIRDIEILPSQQVDTWHQIT